MQRSETPVKQGPFGIFYGWWMAGAGAIIVTVGSIQTSVSSVFFLPITETLGLTYTATSLVFTLARFEGGIEGPAVGWMIDKYGPRLPIIIGAALGGTGLLVMSRVNSYPAFMIVYITMVSLGFQMGFLQCMHAVANLWFVRYRTRAMSIFSSSFRLGWAIFTPVVAIIVARYGWRDAAVMIGVFVLVTALPLSRFIRRSPESIGLLPDGARPEFDQVAQQGMSENPQTVASSPAATVPLDFSFKEALRTRAFWIIAFSTSVRLSTQSALGVHAIPIFVWKGMSEQSGAYMVGLVAGVAVPMILAVGWLGDKMSKRTILLVAQVALSLAFVALAMAESLPLIYVYVLLFAFGANVSPVNYSILGEYFGRKVFARLRGALISIGMVGALTPIYAGWVFDTRESYTMALLTFSVLAVIAAVLLMFMRQPHKREAQVGGQAQQASQPGTTE